VNLHRFAGDKLTKKNYAPSPKHDSVSCHLLLKCMHMIDSEFFILTDMWLEHFSSLQGVPQSRCSCFGSSFRNIVILQGKLDIVYPYC